MNKSKLIIASAIAVVIFLSTSFFIVLNAHHQAPGREGLRRMADAHRNKIGDAEKELYKASFATVQQEVAACDRLGLPKEEKAKRIEAVSKAAQTEMMRVRASHYRLRYQPPVTD